jgi:hypothetical protein
MCPVDETGKNSVNPSIMARMIASNIPIKTDRNVSKTLVLIHDFLSHRT